jgi:hypothetical protein
MFEAQGLSRMVSCMLAQFECEVVVLGMRLVRAGVVATSTLPPGVEVLGSTGVSCFGTTPKLFDLPLTIGQYHNDFMGKIFLGPWVSSIA